ncbi:MAG: DUF2378 family protein [Myxococcota bacterium]
MGVPFGFTEPNFDDGDDTDERLPRIPKDAWVRGMFLQEIVDEGRTRGVDLGGSFTAFHKYPLDQFMRLLQRGAHEIYPDLPFGRALYELGRVSYPNFAKSLAGKALFAVAAGSFRRFLELSTRGYEVTTGPAKVTTRFLSSTEAIVTYRQVWAYPATYQVGVAAGAMETTGVTGELRVQRLDLDQADLYIRWRRR